MGLVGTHLVCNPHHKKQAYQQAPKPKIPIHPKHPKPKKKVSSGAEAAVFLTLSLLKEEMGVSKNNGTPKSSILIGVSIIFTIHFGVFHCKSSAKKNTAYSPCLRLGAM